jgi:hypothetical protein
MHRITVQNNFVTFAVNKVKNYTKPIHNHKALGKNPISVPLLSLVHTRYYKGVGLAGYKQLYSADHSVLPRTNQTKTLFFTGHSHVTMALSK